MTFLSDSVHCGHSFNGLITRRKSHTFFNDVSFRKSKSVVIREDIRKCCVLFVEVTPQDERPRGSASHALYGPFLLLSKFTLFHSALCIFNLH